MYQFCSDTWSMLISPLQTSSVLATSLLSSFPTSHSPVFLSCPVHTSSCSAHLASLLSSDYIIADDWCCLNFDRNDICSCCCRWSTSTLHNFKTDGCTVFLAFSPFFVLIHVHGDLLFVLLCTHRCKHVFCNFKLVMHFRYLYLKQNHALLVQIYIQKSFHDSKTVVVMDLMD